MIEFDRVHLRKVRGYLGQNLAKIIFKMKIVIQ